MNWMDPGQSYDVDVYISLKGPKEFFGDSNNRNNRRKPPIDQSTPVWSLKDLTYSLDTEPNSWNTTVELDLASIEKDVFEKNRTMWVHARVKAENPLHR